MTDFEYNEDAGAIFCTRCYTDFDLDETRDWRFCPICGERIGRMDDPIAQWDMEHEAFMDKHPWLRSEVQMEMMEWRLR